MTADATSSLSPYRLTPELRRSVCIHEAGHAVVAALGGWNCREMAIAPEGATDMTYTDPLNVRHTGQWGCCYFDPLLPELPPLPVLHPDVQTGLYEPRDIDVARGLLGQYLRLVNSAFQVKYYRDLRLWVCTTMAGPLADDAYAGRHTDEHPAVLNTYADRWAEFSQADAYCGLLPLQQRREAKHAVWLTAAALEDYWPAVMTLAEVLEKAGHLSEEAVLPYLPPPLKNWPPPPPTRSPSPSEL